MQFREQKKIIEHRFTRFIRINADKFINIFIQRYKDFYFLKSIKICVYQRPITFLALTLAIIFIPLFANSLDYPHTGVNSIACSSCHFVHGPAPEWYTHVPQDIDDTPYNNLCKSCHDDITAPYRRTHSSLTTDNIYGNWTVECKVCHDPHQQKQFRTYGSESYLYSGQSTAITSNTITRTGAGWTVDQYKGLIIVPNTSQVSYNYKILSNTEDTLTVKGTINLSKVTVGNTFAIIYGKLIKAAISTPNSGSKTTKFFRPTDTNSFSDGDTAYDGVCEICHTQTTHFRNDGAGSDQNHANMGGVVGTKCTNCHKHVNGFIGMGGGAHTTHVTEGYGPKLVCSDCHGTNTPPMLADGQNLANTTVCNNCHGGAAIAKQYWSKAGSSKGTADSWAMVEGEKSYCGSCHDATPGNTKAAGSGDAAKNILGDDTTYGFYVTGHGKQTGNYARLSYQDTTASGNPAANLQRCGQCHGTPPIDENGWPVIPNPPEVPQITPCGFCHDLSTQHFNSANKRLRAGFENDQNNTNCKKCHSYDASEGTAATSEPHFYTRSVDFENSAHKGKLCTECHDVHGTTGAYAGMAKGNKDNLCNQCHTGHAGHALGVSFGKGGKTYSLECVSCHNVHIVSGITSAVTPYVAAMTKFTNNLEIWGDEAGEKMSDFAGSGTYRTPNGDTLSGSQLPDYPSFCLDCHGQDMSPGSIHGNISWGDMHGTSASNSPSDEASCPDWATCGLATGWDGDDCIAADKNDCWPVMTRGKGDTLFSRPVYNHEERIANINFVMSCNDCHVTHVSGSGKIRSTVNGNTTSYPGQWKTLCNACHYYYGKRHAGMSCGAANSCHDANPNPRFGFVSESLHGMPNGGQGGGSRIFDPDLVLDMRFENNLNDSGSWRLHGKWFSTAGSFTTGKVGQAAVLGEDITVQVGTRNSYWSNDEGNHGTWKFTVMKYNTTLEAWVYPTDSAKSEYDIFYPHNGYNNGDYGFSLKKINNTLRAAFNMAADNNGVTQDGRAGIRGAYSSVAVPLNKWTHVAATFDTGGADRNPSDPSVGRIRIYVNGEDVTTSDSSGANMQPGAGETSIFAYAENSPWNQSICFEGTWCASDFSVGGFDWQSTNFIGRIDEAKVWNITNPVSYFNAIDEANAPEIVSAEVTRVNQLTVTFSEGVYTNNNSTGDLVPADFIYTDTDNGRTITAVTHTVGNRTAVLTLSSGLDTSNDIGVDTVAAEATSIFDNYSLAAGTTAVTISGNLTPPAINSAVVSSSNKVTVTFSKAVYTNSGSTGALTPADFTYTDADNGRTITAVTHTAGSTTAVLTLSSNIDDTNDIGVDTVAAVADSIFDNMGFAAGTSAVTITGSLCPSPAIFQLNEAAGSTTVYDDQGYIAGNVVGSNVMTGSAYSGDGSTKYITFTGNNSCLQATTALTIEARIKPTGITVTGNTNYIARIFARNYSATNFQISVWRNNTAYPGLFTAPDNQAVIALWVPVNGTSTYKPVLTNYTGAKTGSENDCPIVSDHWYLVKAVWDTNKAGGTPGQFFTPSDIYIDDQGTDGAGASENWSGYLNCTDSDQSLKTDAVKFYTNDYITSGSGSFAIGANTSSTTNNRFNGLIDWITWKDSVD